MKSGIPFALLGLAAAENSVVSLFIPDTESTTLAGSVVEESHSTTTWDISCAHKSTGDCAMHTTLVAGPTTTQYVASDSSQAFRLTCSMDGTTSGVCSGARSGSAFDFVGSVTTTLDKSDITLLPVTVSGSMPASPATATSTSTSTSSAVKDTEKGSSSQPSPKSSPKNSTEGAEESATKSSSAGSSASSSPSTGGMPRVTGNAGLALGGAAMVLAAAVV
ncbi:hypothetical protein NUU61_010200 [Penicillium alfredii]|uniref:Uncharacterized protein n=1 Tax=Penicillium alfredii TaxID=1506179 RepID=A0A9W9EHK1_9EURO|nr:uncharacterized protein NUU61_010200 [Penicillium alfredii]KAJ5081936.1 hypothetical protein NUU61_010200 [Penicillium alfredii]